MPHALAAFIAERMDQRGLRNRDLVTASGLSRALVSKYATDQRPTLSRLPAKETLDGLAKGLGVSPAFLLGKAIEALGLGYTAGDFVNSVGTATDRELVEELGARLERRLATSPQIVDRAAVTTALWALEQRGELPSDLRQLRNHAVHSSAEALDDFLASPTGAQCMSRLLLELTQAARPLPDPGDRDQAEAYLAGDDSTLIQLQAKKAERERQARGAEAARDRGKPGSVQRVRDLQDEATSRPDPDGPEFGA